MDIYKHGKSIFMCACSEINTKITHVASNYKLENLSSVMIIGCAALDPYLGKNKKIKNRREKKVRKYINSYPILRGRGRNGSNKSTYRGGNGFSYIHLCVCFL